MDSWADPKVLIAIYAAIVSTVALAWNIGTFIHRRKRNAKIKSSIAYEFVQNMRNGDMSKSEALLNIEVVNYSEERIILNKPSLQLNHKVDFGGMVSKSMTVANFQSKNQYPLGLNKGEVFKETIHIISIKNAIDEIKKKKHLKLRIEISDTFGKIYFSKWYKYKNLIGLLESGYKSI